MWLLLWLSRIRKTSCWTVVLFNPEFIQTGLQPTVLGGKHVTFMRACSHVYRPSLFSIGLVSDRAAIQRFGSLCVAPVAINNRHYFNYHQPSPERQDDDSFIIMSQYGPAFAVFPACCECWGRFSDLVVRDLVLKHRWASVGLTFPCRQVITLLTIEILLSVFWHKKHCVMVRPHVFDACIPETGDMFGHALTLKPYSPY